MTVDSRKVSGSINKDLTRNGVPSGYLNTGEVRRGELKYYTNDMEMKSDGRRGNSWSGSFTERELVRGRVYRLGLMISRMIRERTHSYTYTNGHPPQSRPRSAQFKTVYHLLPLFAVCVAVPFIDFRAAAVHVTYICEWRAHGSGACAEVCGRILVTPVC